MNWKELEPRILAALADCTRARSRTDLLLAELTVLEAELQALREDFKSDTKEIPSWKILAEDAKETPDVLISNPTDAGDGVLPSGGTRTR